MRQELGKMSVAMRAMWWAGAFFGAMLLTALIVMPSPLAIAFAPFFPEGLFFFVYTRGSETALLLGWTVYLALGWLLLRTRSARWFAIVYLVLCLCLAVNVGGCKHIADNTRLPHTI